MGTHHKGTAREVRALDAFIKLMRASNSLNARLAAELAAHDLTVSQFGTLEALFHLGPLCQKVIGEKLLKSCANVNLLVDNLEKRGLVLRVRSTTDRRFISVELTARGRALIEEIFPVHAARIVAAFKPLSRQEQDQLSELCKKLGTGPRRA